MKDKTYIFEQMEVPKAVWKMALPTIAGQIVILLYNLADTFFLGKSNNPSMVAAASLILPIQNIEISIAGLAGIGGGAVVASLLGQKKNQKANDVYNLSVFLGIIFALLFSISIWIFITPIINLLGAGSDNQAYAKIYTLCVVVFGALPTVFANTLAALFRSYGYSKQAGFGVMLGGILNIILDPFLIYVILPLFSMEKMEILGVGFATILSNLCSCIYYLWQIHKLNDINLKLRYPKQISKKLKSERDLYKAIFATGIPYAISTLLFDLYSVVLNRLITSYGDTSMAAYGIVAKIERLPLNICTGISQGMMPIVAYTFSAKKYSRLAKVKNYSCMIGLVVAGISLILFELFPKNIISWFIAEEETISLGTSFLRIQSFAIPFMFLCFFHVYLFNGLRKGKQALLLGVLRWVIFNIPILFFMNYIWALNGIMWAEFLGDGISVVFSIIIYKRFKKKNLSGCICR